MTEKKCCSDAERVCNSDCVAYNPNGFSIVRMPRFDRTLPVPQWTWTGTEARHAIVCNDHGFTIETLDILEPEKATDNGN